MKVSVIIGSVRNEREGKCVALFIEKLASQQGWETFLVDPKFYELPLLNKMFKEMENPSEKILELQKKLNDSDGFILVTPEYNHSFSSVLKNLLDHFREEFFLKPSAIVSYSAGNFGGIRAAEQLRIVCAELRMPAIPISFAISNAGKALNDDGTSVEGIYEKRSVRFFKEFQWYLEAMKTQKEKWSPY